MDLVIRRARRSDKRDVLAAVRTIWGGQDRIPDVFDRWVTHRTGPFFVAESGGRVVGMGKLTVVQLGHGWEWREITLRDIRSAIARSRVFVSGKEVGAAAVLGDRYNASLMITAIGGHVAPLTRLLRGLRAEAQRRGLDEVSLYVSNPGQARAARSAGYGRPWSGEVYLFEKRFTRRAGSAPSPAPP